MDEPTDAQNRLVTSDTSQPEGQKTVPQGGSPSSITPPAQEIPSAPPPDQAFVIPSASTTANPFIPKVEQVNSSGQIPTDSPVTVPAAGNPMPKRMFRIAAILAVVLLLGLGVKSVLGLLGGSSKNVELTYWGLWENNATMQSVLGSFEASHPNVTVTYTMQLPRQYRERLQAAIERGDGPDVFRIHNTWVPMFQSQLQPAPENIMSASEFASTFYPVASADLVGGQSIYGMPIMFDGLGLYYNEDLFASAGVTPPSTWEDVLNMVPKLTVKNGETIITSAIALGTVGNVEHYSDILATMMMQNGAKLSVPTGKQAEEALVFYRKFADPVDPVYTWNDSMDNSIFAFASGKVAMILAPSWRVFEVKQINPDLRFQVVPVPQLPGNTVNWASYWAEAVSYKSKHQKEAWELVKYMTSREVATQLFSAASKTRLFGEPYARVDLANTISSDPYVGAYIQQAPSAKSFPLSSRTFDNGINDKMIKYLGDAVNAISGGTAASAALSTTANGFAQVLGSYGLTTVSAPTTTP